MLASKGRQSAEKTLEIAIAIAAYKLDVDCGSCGREGEREYHIVSVCACASEWISVCECVFVCFTLISAQKASTSTKVTGRSLPYAQETYKSQHNYRGRSVPCTYDSRVQTSTRIFHSKVARNFQLELTCFYRYNDDHHDIIIIIIIIVISNCLLWWLPTICAVNVDIRRQNMPQQQRTLILFVLWTCECLAFEDSNVAVDLQLDWCDCDGRNSSSFRQWISRSRRQSAWPLERVLRATLEDTSERLGEARVWVFRNV